MEFTYNNHIIKAFTIKQPWASLIVMGVKDIENRSWRMKVDKLNLCNNWRLVHSSGTFDKPTNLKKGIKKELDRHDWKKFPTSSIIGLMHINKVEECGPTEIKKLLWASGSQCWHIDAVVMFKNPVHAKGALGFWKPKIEIHQQLTTEIENSIKDIKFYYDKLI
jgi:hypothetical protein